MGQKTAQVAVALTKESPRIAAVVNQSGGLPKILTGKVHQMPAILILHGEADKTVPVQEARSFEQLLKEHGRPYEVMIYKEEGHVFQKKAAQDDAVRRTLAFFDK
jgi:carboxymethylenebutenolidase